MTRAVCKNRAAFTGHQDFRGAVRVARLCTQYFRRQSAERNTGSLLHRKLSGRKTASLFPKQPGPTERRFVAPQLAKRLTTCQTVELTRTGDHWVAQGTVNSRPNGFITDSGAIKPGRSPRSNDLASELPDVL
ncbi:MAG: hypothetical protein HY290_10650 [Planctomycetia bacterium]|nr:hypothetical protein [Planctomycetia bacterium]